MGPGSSLKKASKNNILYNKNRQSSLIISKHKHKKKKIDLKNANKSPILDKICENLLNYSLRRIALRKFHCDTIQLKPTPSVGARHGLELFVQRNDGLYYYDCARHALIAVEKGLSKFEGDLRFHVMVRAEVYMWRYPYGSCLLDVYFDLGHTISNMALIAKVLNLPPPTMLSPDISDLEAASNTIGLGSIDFDNTLINSR